MISISPEKIFNFILVLKPVFSYKPFKNAHFGNIDFRVIFNNLAKQNVLTLPKLESPKPTFWEKLKKKKDVPDFENSFVSFDLNEVN